MEVRRDQVAPTRSPVFCLIVCLIVWPVFWPVFWFGWRPHRPGSR